MRSTSVKGVRAQIILGPRPGKKSKDSIQVQGVTDIVTLLSEREQPETIRKIAASIGADWHHFPMAGGHIDTLQQTDLAKLFQLYDEIASARETPVIYLHCSAGIHRTGFIVYLLLRYCGASADAARTDLAALRPVTAAQVGDDRLALAEARFEAWQQA